MIDHRCIFLLPLYQKFRPSILHGDSAQQTDFLDFARLQHNHDHSIQIQLTHWNKDMKSCLSFISLCFISTVFVEIDNNILKITNNVLQCSKYYQRQLDFIIRASVMMVWDIGFAMTIFRYHPDQLTHYSLFHQTSVCWQHVHHNSIRSNTFGK